MGRITRLRDGRAGVRYSVRMAQTLTPVIDKWPAFPALADLFRPGEQVQATMYNIGLVVAGSLLIAASAWVEIRLPFSLVTVTGQSFAVLLVGALLGPWLGAAAVVMYLAQGAAGLPVFAGGAAGVAWIFGPTGGYLFGFIAAAWITGTLARRGWDRSPAWTALAMVLGNGAIYVVALPWLAVFVGAQQAVVQGFVPFIPGAAVKIALATAILPIGWRVLRTFAPPTSTL